MSDNLNALPKGYRLEEYEVVRLLGAGGFGLTYLGFDHNLDKPVAIKEYLPNDMAIRGENSSVLPKSTADQVDFDWGLNSFLAEARTLARFDNPNLIKVYRFFRAHGTGYIVMEYAEGETFSEYMTRAGLLDEGRLKAIMLPLMDGLAEVHAANFLHRDIKPGNIMIRDDGSPVLIDFGAARMAVGAKSRSLTAIVTPGYAPIEQYDTKGNQGPWTDIYALAAVAYKALTGAPPHDATGRVRRDPLVPVAKAAEGCASPAFLRAIDSALEVDEPDRPQSVAAWREMLDGAGSQAKPKQGKKPAVKQAKPDQPVMSDAAKRLAEKSMRPKTAGKAAKTTGSNPFIKAPASGSAGGNRMPAGSTPQELFDSYFDFGNSSKPAQGKARVPIGPLTPHWSYWVLVTLAMLLVVPMSFVLIVTAVKHAEIATVEKADMLGFMLGTFAALGGWALVFRSKVGVFLIFLGGAIFNVMLVTMPGSGPTGWEQFWAHLISIGISLYPVYALKKGWLKPAMAAEAAKDPPGGILVINMLLLIGSVIFSLGMIFGITVDGTEFKPFNVAMIFAFFTSTAACVSLSLIRAPYARIYALLALISWVFYLYLRSKPDGFDVGSVVFLAFFLYLLVISHLAVGRGWLRRNLDV